MSFLLFLALFLSFTSFSSAQYCLCKPGSQTPDPYTKVINFACGNGANCGPIQQNGPCYQANNVQAICSYAANSYYQNQKSMGATCDFGGVAAPSPTLPTDVPSGCTYPTSAGTGSNSTTVPTSPTGGTTSPPGSISPPGSFPTPPGGFITPPGGFSTPPGGGSTPGVFSPMGQGPSGSLSDPGLNDATSLLQTQTYIVSFSLTLLAGLSIFLG